MARTRADVEGCSHAETRAFSHVASGDGHAGLRMLPISNVVGVIVSMCLVGVSLHRRGQST